MSDIRVRKARFSVSRCEIDREIEAMLRRPPPKRTAQVLYRKTIEEHIAPLMREHGFKKRAHRWGKRTADGWIVLDLEASQWSNRHELYFAVRLGVWSSVVAGAMGQRLRANVFPPAYKCHFIESLPRVTRTRSTVEWTIRADRSIRATARAAGLFVEEVGISRLMDLCSDAMLFHELTVRRGWRLQPIRTSVALAHRFMNARAFRTFCGVLARGDPSSMKELLRELKLPSRRLAAESKKTSRRVG